jgi:hypothetical protein
MDIRDDLVGSVMSDVLPAYFVAKLSNMCDVGFSGKPLKARRRLFTLVLKSALGNKNQIETALTYNIPNE